MAENPLFDDAAIAGSRQPSAESAQPKSGSGQADSAAVNRIADDGSTTYFHPGAGAPLAARMRPRNLAEVVGQQHVLGAGKPLERLINGQGENSVILYGPPGTGKTTLASLISQATARKFVALSALSAGVKEVREVIAAARKNLAAGQPTVLFIDEVHRFSKTQQDALLAAVENRIITLVAATTENPSFAVVAPLLSRSLVIQLQPLAEDDIATLLHRAITDIRGLDGRITVAEPALEQLVRLSGGDARRALTYLEAVAETVPTGGELTAAMVADNMQQAVVRYDRSGDQHYDVTSALIKSIRGSDVDASLHYLARMIHAGEDPRFICRRLIILASEDIGLADPQALVQATATADAVHLIGLPEARINLAQLVVYLALAPKSNAVYHAIDAAIADVAAGLAGPVPVHLRDGHYAGAEKLGHAQGYNYPHHAPRGVVQQQYMPTALEDKQYYQPAGHGEEARLSQVHRRLRSIVRGTDDR
ncbi:replication-associated recombination protein A [Corynebacterium choanae]|uniref:Replication-associated recombination protein A n=1 Tax=Corynebacterium choanae TaxID=1862358 RepID=A0A3G6JAZ5_9CORY|nr:replication-associated recombination protein A [Corynebacterium choanae]AZA13680.1 Replication-associated recombination protein A [Corynebacterium choanae]